MIVAPPLARLAAAPGVARAALLTALVAACSRAPRPASVPSASPAPSATADSASNTTAAASARAIPVDVENNYRADVSVILVRGSQRRRLGTVPPNARRRLLVPASFAADQGGFALLADPVAGGESVLSQTVVARPGQRLVWTLESRLARSVLAVY